MKTSSIIGIVVLVIILFIGATAFGTYNNLVTSEENVEQKFSDIETQLQGRADKIPNLVATVKGYAKHEEAIIDKVTSARSEYMNAKTPEEKMEANKKIDSALSQLLVVVENYPDLKADKAFTQLMDELAGTENRIIQARKEYNSAVKEYNKSIKVFPGVLFAKMLGFSEKEYFEASPEADKVPEVNFD